MADFAMLDINDVFRYEASTEGTGNYSEIFMDTPFGAGVGRLAVDPFSYYVFTSDASEIAEIEAMVDGGVSYEDAIREMVKKYRS